MPLSLEVSYARLCLCNRPPALITTDAMMGPCRPGNPACGSNACREKTRRKPNPFKAVVQGNSLNVLTLLFDFYSSASGNRSLLTEVCQPNLVLHAYPNSLSSRLPTPSTWERLGTALGS